MGGVRRRPGARCSLGAARPARRAGRRPGLPAPAGRGRRRPARLHRRAALVPVGRGRRHRGPPAAIAYFSPEYGITAVLPQYSGGLGILAGDHLKSASDLGVPLIGVGLLYRHGYFTQSLSADGWQAERYPADDPNGLPLTLLRDADTGDAVHVTVALAGGKQLTAQVWLAQVGRVPLLLLDSYVEDNEPALHEVTDRLYGGGSEHRLRQEMLLGIGGVRAVRAFCAITGHPEPEVFHTNEGHAGFLGLERIREYVAAGPRLRRGARAVPGRHGVHHAHAGAGRHRPVPARAGGAVLRRGRGGMQRCRSSGCSRSARRPTRAGTRTSSTWP